jgi:hypothetical protein
MTRLVWNASSNPNYEYGVDRGVLNSKTGVVVPWNGLISVTQKEIDGIEIRAQFDGVTYVNERTGGYSQITVTANAFPDALRGALGEVAVVPGFNLTGQMRDQFDFCYRTMISETRYKLHFIHGALLTPTKRGYNTINDSPSPSTFTWVLDVVPPSSLSYRPTSHLIIDSSTANATALTNLENLLYGTSSTTPSFPTQSAILALFP